MEWINAKDRLPELKNTANNRLPDLKASDPVLAVGKCGEMRVVRYETDIDDEDGTEMMYWNMGDNTDTAPFGYFTHWMPLPEPPKD